MPSDSEKIDVLIAELLRSYQGELYRFVFSICPNQTAVEDITQETNRVLWEKRADFEIGTDFRAWIRSIARFQTLNYVKTSRRKSWLHFDTGLVDLLAADFESNQELQTQRQTYLDQCIERLSDQDRNIVELKYKNNESLRTIGHRQNRTVGALKQAFMRIRKQLKDCIQRKVHADNNG